MELREKFIHFFQNEDIKKCVKEIIKPIGTYIYNEIYIYIWFLCIYNVVLMFIIVLVFILLIRSEYKKI